MRDRLHQPYRQKLIPGAGRILSAFRAIKDCGASVSGSGPSMLVLGGPGVSDARVRSVFAEAYRKTGKRFRFFPLKVDRRGAVILR